MQSKISALLAAASLFSIALFLSIPAAQATSVTTSYSSNWSGYVGTAPTPFSSVSASWTVPSVANTPKPAYSSVWVGIGGSYINSNKLVQAGTEQDVNKDGSKVYSAWYEVYPKAPVTVGDVNPGDSITTSIHKVSDSPPTWHITIRDSTTSTTLVDKDVRVKANFAAQASAEFIVERPLIRLGNQLTPLADFDRVEFTDCDTNQGGLGSLTDATKIVMTDDGSSSGTVLATPSGLSGDDFHVDWGT